MKNPFNKFLTIFHTRPKKDILTPESERNALSESPLKTPVNLIKDLMHHAKRTSKYKGKSYYYHKDYLLIHFNNKIAKDRKRNKIQKKSRKVNFHNAKYN